MPSAGAVEDDCSAGRQHVANFSSPILPTGQDQVRLQAFAHGDPDFPDESPAFLTFIKKGALQWFHDDCIAQAERKLQGRVRSWKSVRLQGRPWGTQAMRLGAGRGKHLLALAAAAAFAASAQAADCYAIDSTHSIPTFAVKHFGAATQRGRFAGAAGWVSLDTKRQRGSVNLVIDASTVDIGSSTGNALLRSAAMLDTARHPLLSFHSDYLLFAGDRVVGASGTIDISGRSRPIRLEIDDFTCRTHPLLHRKLCGADVSATLSRSDFGLTGWLGEIGDSVRIDMPVEAIAIVDAGEAGAVGRSGATTGDLAAVERRLPDGCVFAAPGRPAVVPGT